jgi:hypothetical protein
VSFVYAEVAILSCGTQAATSSPRREAPTTKRSLDDEVSSGTLPKLAGDHLQRAVGRSDATSPAGDLITAVTTTQTTVWHQQHRFRPGRSTRLRAPRDQAVSSLDHHTGRQLPPRDRNEQHRVALQHHPTNTARLRRAVRSATCLHLLIAGSPASPSRTTTHLPGRTRAPYQGHQGSTTVTHVTYRGVPVGQHQRRSTP